MLIFHSNKSESYTLEITDAIGKALQVLKGKSVVGSNKININLTAYAEGMYFIKLTDL